MNEIYLCDSELFWLQRMERAVNSFQIRSDWELSVVGRTRSPRELLPLLQSRGTGTGIYLLDVGHGTGMDGMELGAEIRRLDGDAFLIYVTSHENLAGAALEAFRRRLLALDLIVKDPRDFQDRICQSLSCIEEILARREDEAELLTLENRSSHRFFPKKEIYFIESVKGFRQIALHTASEVYRYPATLRECCAKLQRDFLLCRRDCLVNLRHIRSADRPSRTLLLDNGAYCSCSVRQWEVFVRQYGRQD